MGSAAKKLLKEVLTLPEADRRELCEVLWASVSEEDRQRYEREWNEEALARANAVEAGASRPLPGDKAVLYLEQKLRQRRRP